MRTPVMNKQMVDDPDVPGSAREWYVIDVEGKALGRAATRIAMVLRGKHKPTFSPHTDMGDFVIVVNAEKVGLSGRKPEQKMYYRHSQWPGGLKQATAREMLEKKPEEVMRHAVKGMLPKGRLGRKLLKKLKVYSGPEHPHAAQKPQALSL